MDPYYKGSVLASVSVVQFPAAHSRILSAMSNKVYFISNTDGWYGSDGSFQGSVGLVSRFGQFYKSVDPGLVQVNVCTESLRIVDVKIQISPIGRQTVMFVPFELISSIILS